MVYLQRRTLRWTPLALTIYEHFTHTLAICIMHPIQRIVSQEQRSRRIERQFTGRYGRCTIWALGRGLMKLLFCQRRPPYPISTIYNRATECSNNALTASKQVSRVHATKLFLCARAAAETMRSRADMGRTHTRDLLSQHTHAEHGTTDDARLSRLIN